MCDHKCHLCDNDVASHWGPRDAKVGLRFRKKLLSRLQEAEEAKTEMIRSHINAYNILNIRALSRRPAAQWTVMAACPQYKNTYQLAA